MRNDLEDTVGKSGAFGKRVIQPELDRARQFLGVAEVDCMGCLLDERDSQMLGTESGDLADAGG